MSLNDSFDKRFSSIGEELDVKLEKAEKSGDKEAIDDINSVRCKIGSLGVQAYRTEYVDRINGDKRVLGQILPSSGQMGLASYEIMKAVGLRAGLSTATVYKMVIDHEHKHEEIHHTEGTHEVQIKLTQQFDPEKVKMVEDGVISFDTSEAIDGYKANRDVVDEMAAAIGSNRFEFCRIIENGDVKKLANLMAVNGPNYGGTEQVA